MGDIDDLNLHGSGQAGAITETIPSYVHQTGRVGIAIGCYRGVSDCLTPQIDHIVEERPAEEQNALVPLRRSGKPKYNI